MGGLFRYPPAPHRGRIASYANWHIVVSYFECTERTHGMSGCGTSHQFAAAQQVVGYLDGCPLKQIVVGEPDAGNPHVRFDERGWETERWRMPQAIAPFLDSTEA